MRTRLYTGKDHALAFNSKVLSFQGQVLTFWSVGLQYFDVEGFTYNEAEMGAATITCDMFVDPAVIPAFDRLWYVDYRGERYYLSTLTPALVKDTSSLRYKYTLIYKSQRADLERYEFADFVTITPNVKQPTSYSPTLALTVTQFVERFNINLDYYFGAGVWQMVLDPLYMDNINPIIYDGTSVVTTSFSRETLWSLLTGLYDIYGLRWKIASDGGIMTIRLGYVAELIVSHDTALHPRWNDSGDPTIFGTDRFGFGALPSAIRNALGGYQFLGNYMSLYINNVNPVGKDAFFCINDYGRTNFTIFTSYGNGFGIRLVRPLLSGEDLLSDGTIIPNAFSDADGNNYYGTKIGLQVWTTTNLKTTKYADGTTIPTNLSDVAWAADTVGACAVYGKNDDAFVPTDELTTEALMVAAYGRLYNWYAVDNEHGLIDSTDGWHVPSDAEFTQLTDYLIATYPEITIDNVGDVLKSTRMVNSPHLIVFEYGFDNGLISIERVNPNTPVYTRLSGRGSDKNLPYRYFDSSTSQYIDDPDNNEFTQNVPYTNLMPASYREYVQGWNDASIGSVADSSHYAYELGYSDKQLGYNFNPVDYVISESAEAIYGIRKGSVADVSSIYPTFQNASTGTLDEIVGVEQVLNDDYNGTDTSLNQVVANAMSVCKYIGTSRGASHNWNLTTGNFNTTAEFDNISFGITFDVSHNASTNFSYAYEQTVKIIDVSTNAVIDSSVMALTVFNPPAYSLINEFSFIDMAPGNYKITVDTSMGGNSDHAPMTVTQGLTNITRHPTNTYKETFDIWVKNIWDSSQGGSESDADYKHRIWDPLVAPNKDMTVMFSSGMLAGDYEFVIARDESPVTAFHIYPDTTITGSHWRLSLIKSSANLTATKLMYPNMVLNASIGDKFFFTNIEMPYYPYVYEAENRLEAYINNELLKTNNENPTYAIKPSAVFLEMNASINDSIQIGSLILLKDEHIFGTTDAVKLTITNLSINYKTGVLLPEWNITIAEKPTSAKNSVQIIQGDIKVLSSNMLSAQQLSEQAALLLDSRYLRKDGPEQFSKSKTRFEDTLYVDGKMQSTSYLQGQIGGYGFAIYKDANQDYVLDIDKLNVRKTLTVNELVINQVSIYGGIHIYSAAAMTVSAVDSSNAAYTVCSLDIKNGTVLNQFTVGDHAYCQRVDPSSNEVVKYYWKEVVGVGNDYINISMGSGDGSGLPTVGDNIAQLGNSSNFARQSALIIDQTNGGTVTQYAGISGYSFVDKDYIRYGVDPSTGRAYERIYGDMFFGDRGENPKNFIQYDSSTGVMTTSFLLANKAEIAGFIYKDGLMISKQGTIDGSVSVDWTNAGFVPNLKFNGSTGSLEAAGGRLKALADGSFEIEFTTNITRYTPSGGAETIAQTVTINNTTGVIQLRTSDSETAEMTSQGILANKAGIQAIPVSSGIELKGAVVGLGFGDLAADAYSGLAAICGVYGDAVNTNASPAPAYGGYFQKVKTNGLYLHAKSVTSNYDCTDKDNIISCYNTTYITIGLPEFPYSGQVLSVRRNNTAAVNVTGRWLDTSVTPNIWRGKQIIQVTVVDEAIIGSRGDRIELVFDDSYWIWNATNI